MEGVEGGSATDRTIDAPNLPLPHLRLQTQRKRVTLVFG